MQIKDAKFLVVDDVDYIRDAIAIMLKHSGYVNIATAGDGQEALGLLQKEKFDIVVTDNNMPNMTGLELARVIRSDEKLKYLPVIMMSGNLSAELDSEAKKAGVDALLPKPFKPDELLSDIDRITTERSNSGAKPSMPPRAPQMAIPRNLILIS